MTRSKIRIFYHFVWATQNREWFLESDVEQEVHRLIQSLAREKHCDVLAINGMPDHIHLVIKAPATISASELMQHIKGVSSSTLRQGEFKDQAFGWQDGYGVFSLSRRDLQDVVAYVRNQKVHHSDGKLKPSLEDTNEEVAD
ncbi:hypothetical protein IAD21_03321 [Abditibacteriota bacterium]|nr:hypothetical protein IAD21_03321 [Abditibacteriota bacterium]